MPTRRRQPAPARPFLVRKPAQIRSLASPVRQEIVDALVAAGPCSVADLAAHLGRRPDALYFHLRRLIAVGLVLERSPRRNGRHVASVYDVPGRPVRFGSVAQASAPAVYRVVSAALRLGARDFGRALPKAGGIADGPSRNLWGGRVKGWVSDTELTEINRLITRLNEILRSGRPPSPSGSASIGATARNPQTFSFVLAPAKPARRRPRNGARQ